MVGGPLSFVHSSLSAVHVPIELLDERVEGEANPNGLTLFLSSGCRKMVQSKPTEVISLIHQKVTGISGPVFGGNVWTLPAIHQGIRKGALRGESARGDLQSPRVRTRIETGGNETGMLNPENPARVMAPGEGSDQTRNVA